MPLNLRVFKARTLTALVFAALVLGALFWKPESFFVLLLVVATGSWLEYDALAEKTYGIRTGLPVRVAGILLTLFGLFCAAGYFLSAVPLLQTSSWQLRWILLTAFFLLIMLLPVAMQQMAQEAKARYMFGIIYIGFSLGTLMMIRARSEQGLVLTCGIVFSIWINDTMAYITGSLFGKTPLSKISPKKTWEGTIGGVVLAVLVVSLLGRFLPAARSITMQQWICIALISAVTGTLGDLFESKLKRMANVKDSGNILPGHGGFLDRFDSLLFAAPSVWLYLWLTGTGSLQ